MTDRPIEFSLQFNPVTNKWRWRVAEANPAGVGTDAFWSEALGFANLVKVLQTETRPVAPVEDWGKRRDGMPVVHAVKGQGPTEAMSLTTLSEVVRGPDGKKIVRRIPATRAEAQAQQLAELMALLEDGE